MVEGQSGAQRFARKQLAKLFVGACVGECNSVGLASSSLGLLPASASDAVARVYLHTNGLLTLLGKRVCGWGLTHWGLLLALGAQPLSRVLPPSHSGAQRGIGPWLDVALQVLYKSSLVAAL